METCTSKSDNDLARTLIIELLTHQFCFPVQWIQTQDLVLEDKATQRMVEMGPGKTLVNMARRTAQSKYAALDAAGNISRKFLAFHNDLEQISYLGNPASSVVSDSIPNPPATSSQPSKSVPDLAKVAPSEPTAAVTPTTTPASNVEVQDSPVAIVDIVIAIVSASLTRPLNTPDLSQTVKALCMGRSTLQNEIIGDLHAEFENLPDNAEELTLEALCEMLQPTFRAKLGKKSRLLIDRMSSQKLPGTFTSSEAREHLQRRWRLGPGRQDTVLLHAAQAQPEGRMKEEEAKQFFDGVAQAYMAQHGLTLPDPSSDASATGQPAFVDAEALKKMELRQRAGWAEQLALYSGLLGLNVHASHATIGSLHERIAELQQQLDQWNDEHGEVYASGIRSIFKPQKARTYDSWWNWAIQDLLTVIGEAHKANSPHDPDHLSGLTWRIINRSYPRLVSALRCYLNLEKDAEISTLLQSLLLECEDHVNTASMSQPLGPVHAPQTMVDTMGKIQYREVERPSVSAGRQFEYLQLARKGPKGWNPVEGLSHSLWQVLDDVQHSGLSLNERSVLITGAGEGSIGYMLVARMLSAGAHVIVTSSSFSPKVARVFQKLYSKHGGKGSRLTLVPFNQASSRDVEALMKYIYDDKEGLGTDLDFLIPFAAISENGRDVSSLDSKSLLAQRLMLTNTVRLIGQVKKEKQARGLLTRPTQVILPLSPNHGEMGNDGLYAESKLGLEALLEKFHSEDWADFLLVCAVAIGWTRGTKLTADNDVVAEGMEKVGIRTFTQDEIAFYITALMTGDIVQLCIDEPLVADFTGGMDRFPNLKSATSRIRKELQLESEEWRMRTEDKILQNSVHDDEAELDMQTDPQFSFPALPDWETELDPLASELEGMVDPSRVVVIAGFAELGPWGNAQTRWDMEFNGRLSAESCIQLAWSMGLIKAHSGVIDGQPFSGWLDQSTGKPISDANIKDKYESFILEHAGIRYLEQKEGSSKWDEREALHEIEITRDCEPFEVSRETAMELKQAHGENVQLIPATDEARLKVVLAKGARIMVPKLVSTQHTVGGQLPTGWRASVYGVPEGIARQVDPSTLYGLVATAEALRNSGVLDPYELYEHVHVSDVANCTGSGLGGGSRLRDVFKGRYQDADLPKDILAESFISSCSAWLNMLLLSGAGANKTPVGACATALESLDTACELLQDGKAKICLVGSFEDMLKDVSEEFANLGATINVKEDVARGREPSEMSRPMTSTRAGFVEAEGAGIQIVTTASVALEMGLPIHAIVALTHTAMDKAGRSIPAPGRGLLSAAKQRSTKFDSPLMSMAYRRRTLQARLQQVDEMCDLQISHMQQTLASDDPCRDQQLASILNDAERDKCEARNQYGNHFWTHDDRISPIRGALAVWGLTVDDIDVVSLHGTSTNANDPNESALLDQQFQHLGRREGHVVPMVCQKSLTGHPKGPAGAWMLNGCLQMMREGQIPGNHNADNIDSELQQHQYLVYPNKSLEKPNMKAFALQLFGFGQKGGMALGVHPRYLYATLPRAQYEAYTEARRSRETRAARCFSEGMFKNNIFEAKEKPPYREEEEAQVLLNPLYRREAM